MDIALEFAERAAACASDAELHDLVEAATLDLGFRHYAIVHHVRFRRDDPQFLSLDNYPQGWAEEFVGDKLFVDDPILQASTRTAKGFAWDRVGTLLPIRPRHAAVIERSARYGMGSGFTVPANIPGEPNGSCSFAAKPGRTIGEKALRLAELIGIDAFDAARRIHGRPVRNPVPHLSRRELQVLRGAASGASDKAIARELGISPETARRYMKSARSAYGTASRTAMVVAALQDGQIGFDDCAIARAPADRERS
jgi:LuxR family quorum-sensing system transcriptional regulator CciR